MPDALAQACRRQLFFSGTSCSMVLSRLRSANNLKSKLSGLAAVAAVMLSCCIVLSAQAKTSTLTVNPPSTGQQTTNYGVFRYNDDDAVIKSEKTPEQLGYQSSAPSATLSLSDFSGRGYLPDAASRYEAPSDGQYAGSVRP